MNDSTTSNPSGPVLGLKLAAVALAVILAVGFLMTAPKSEASKVSEEISAQQLEGTWLIGDLADPDHPKFMETYNAGGGVQTTGTLGRPGTATEGHGGWVRTGNRTFAAKVVILMQEEDGTYAGSLILNWKEITIDRSGNTVNIKGSASIRNAVGVEEAGFPVDIVGTRIRP